jgi:hypothetical protein
MVYVNAMAIQFVWDCHLTWKSNKKIIELKYAQIQVLSSKNKGDYFIDF